MIGVDLKGMLDTNSANIYSIPANNALVILGRLWRNLVLADFDKVRAETSIPDQQPTCHPQEWHSGRHAQKHPKQAGRASRRQALRHSDEAMPSHVSTTYYDVDSSRGETTHEQHWLRSVSTSSSCTTTLSSRSSMPRCARGGGGRPRRVRVGPKPRSDQSHFNEGRDLQLVQRLFKRTCPAKLLIHTVQQGCICAESSVQFAPFCTGRKEASHVGPHAPPPQFLG